METIQIMLAISPAEYAAGIAATVISALLIGVGSLLWRQTGKVQELSLQMAALTKEVERLRRMVESGRKWRFERTPLPEPDED